MYSQFRKSSHTNPIFQINFFPELSEYKYAGYSQLIKTIDLEAKDEALFIKGGGDLLSAAIELANYTLISSALNAEQLRRDNGLEVNESKVFSILKLFTGISNCI